MQLGAYNINHLEMFEILSTYMQFKSVFIYKITTPNKLKSIIFGEYDIFVYYIPSGSHHINLAPIFNYYHLLYVTIPLHYTVSPIYFIELFNGNLWIGIFVIYSVLLTFLTIYKYIYKLKVNQYFESIFHAIGVSSEQIIFSTIAYSICIIISSLLFFVLSEYFGTFLTTKLSIKSENKLPFERLEDLATQTKYKICLFPGDSFAEKSISNDIKYKHIFNAEECRKIDGLSFIRTLIPTIKWFCNNPNLVLLAPNSLENFLKMSSR